MSTLPDTKPSADKPASGTRLRFGLLFLGIVGVSLVIAAALFIYSTAKPRGPIAQLTLADGRTLQVEAVTYGTKHRVGSPSIFYERFRPWLPDVIRRRLAPKSPENVIQLEQPALVVWVNAINPATGTNVDCQAIHVEFVDEHGDVLGSADAHWFGGQSLWRVGHVFYCYPRSEKELTFRVTPWKKGKATPSTAKFSNPHVAQPGNWTGQPVPLTNSVGSLQMVLKQINSRTNEAKYYQSATRFFEPVLELREQGLRAQGWDEPEWTAEDSTGNRGLHLGVHHAALRFTATAFPLATNLDATVVLTTLPPINLTALTNRTWWNTSHTNRDTEIVVLGICPPGVQVFSEGSFDPSGPTMAAVRGGARSGWMGQSKWITPMKLKRWQGHYTPDPTIYVRRVKTPRQTRLAVRLRDDQGRYWIAEPEPQQGMNDDIYAFLLKLPAPVSAVVPEVVLLKPVQAEFLAATQSPSSP